MTTTPTLAQLKHAISISEQIESLKHELAGILGSHSAPVVKAAPVAVKADGRKGKRSPATIAKMKASQKKRWAKVKVPVASKAPVPAAPKKKGGMSPAHKAKLAAAAKKRWAAIKAGKAPNPFASKKK